MNDAALRKHYKQRSTRSRGPPALPGQEAEQLSALEGLLEALDDLQEFQLLIDGPSATYSILIGCVQPYFS